MQCHGSLQFPDFRPRACSPAVEDEAQRSAAQLVQASVSPVGPSAALPRVDVDSLELVRPRSVGVEHVALWAMRQLRLPSLLEELGLSGPQRAIGLFDLQPTVTLHDRTNTCLEGTAAAGGQRVTAVFRQADGRMLHARRATRAEAWQRAIHERLGVDASPSGVRKLIVQLRRRRKMHGM